MSANLVRIFESECAAAKRQAEALCVTSETRTKPDVLPVTTGHCRICHDESDSLILVKWGSRRFKVCPRCATRRVREV